MLQNYQDLSFVHEWQRYSDNLATELTQCLDEGKDVEAYRTLVETISAMPIGKEKALAADALFYLLMNAPQRADYPFVEPSDYQGILDARPANRRTYQIPAADDALRDKIAGAWLGRICGCLLGKPVEGMRTPDLWKLLAAEDNLPLKRYIGRDKETLLSCGIQNPDPGRCWAFQKLGYMPPDDDTNYTVMAAKVIIEKYGRNFTPADVANAWLSSQPITAYCTAERVAFMNFVNAIAPPQSAVYQNPYREWIGAQIRADYFGYINPGDPETAADMAFRDASISHIRNGIYGEMFIAAAIAAAACTQDPEEILLAGLDQIPEKSRLTRDVKAVIDFWKSGKSEKECFTWIHEIWDEFSAHHWCHTNSNAMIVAASLLYGGMDYGKSICMAVETGFDTDCNGATVGSIIGMAMGKACVGPEWYEAICDTVDTSIIGCGMYSLSELADITMGHLK